MHCPDFWEAEEINKTSHDIVVFSLLDENYIRILTSTINEMKHIYLIVDIRREPFHKSYIFINLWNVLDLR